MQLLDSNSSSVVSLWMGGCPGAAPTFMTLKDEYAWRAARDMKVTVGSMCLRTRGPEAFRPRPMPEADDGEVGDDGVGTKLARVEGIAGGMRGEEEIGESEGSRRGGVPGSGMTSIET